MKIKKLEEMQNDLKELKNLIFSWKYWLASFVVLAINGVIAGVIMAIMLFSGFAITKEIFYASWCSAVFSCVIWIMLIELTREKKKREKAKKRED